MMMSDENAMLLLDQLMELIPENEEILKEKAIQMKNRFRYRIDQAKPVELKFHKGIHRPSCSYWTCSNCGCTITHKVVQNFCWNCGHAIKWNTIRCLTGYKSMQT